MANSSCELGMVGLGVMGRNLLLNMADQGFTVAGYDKDRGKVDLLGRESDPRNIHPAYDVKGLLAALRAPRAMMIMVPAGPAVDAVLAELLPHLVPGDVVVDGGNSHFRETEARQARLAERHVFFLGVGISGGEAGARHGPSLMPGGPAAAYPRVQPIFEAIAAKVQGDPCIAYLGPAGSGHYVKMVHNGIEYGLMRLIAETYDLMKRGLGIGDEEMAAIYAEWNEEFQSYLLEITAEVLRKRDLRTGKPLVEMIVDEAAQKGTGAWTSESALELQVPSPSIDIAVSMRFLSMLKTEREAAGRTLDGPASVYRGDSAALVRASRGALAAATMIVFAQGMALLRKASDEYGYALPLAEVAGLWRGGCIIRAAILEQIRTAFGRRPDLPNLLLDPTLAGGVQERQDDLRAVAAAAAHLGISVPAFMVALGYFDAYRSAWMPANLIQAQRDLFGAHTYERLDERGTFHALWETPGPAAAEERIESSKGGPR